MATQGCFLDGDMQQLGTAGHLKVHFNMFPIGAGHSLLAPAEHREDLTLEDLVRVVDLAREGPGIVFHNSAGWSRAHRNGGGLARAEGPEAVRGRAHGPHGRGAGGNSQRTGYAPSDGVRAGGGGGVAEERAAPGVRVPGGREALRREVRRDELGGDQGTSHKAEGVRTVPPDHITAEGPEGSASLSTNRQPGVNQKGRRSTMSKLKALVAGTILGLAVPGVAAAGPADELNTIEGNVVLKDNRVGNVVSTGGIGVQAARRLGVAFGAAEPLTNVGGIYQSRGRIRGDVTITGTAAGNVVNTGTNVNVHGVVQR